MRFKNANGTVITVTNEVTAELMRKSAAFEEIPEKAEDAPKKSAKKTTK